MKGETMDEKSKKGLRLLRVILLILVLILAAQSVSRLPEAVPAVAEETPLVTDGL
jgi:hypothetical protein